MAPLPEDLERWVAAHFPAADVNIARELLASAIDHTGATPGARLLRCAAVGSRGDLVQLRYLMGLLQIDYRDVIMFGEYDVVEGKLVHVRNLNEPLP
ncbi:MAG TPA: hypothetical protein VFJ70_22850 [Burkholderiales bacterium]|nr:hypothetical protein [Burkholderiales bacterium]